MKRFIPSSMAVTYMACFTVCTDEAEDMAMSCWKSLSVPFSRFTLAAPEELTPWKIPAALRANTLFTSVVTAARTFAQPSEHLRVAPFTTS
ncbi:hypothetical protein CESP606_17380 [Cereibacter sphaeroides]